MINAPAAADMAAGLTTYKLLTLLLLLIKSFFFFYNEETSFVWGGEKMQAGRVTQRKQSKDNKTTLIGPIDQTTVCCFLLHF